jgi:dTDP-4-dehydrorhamnose reductase
VLELMSRASIPEPEGEPLSGEIWHVADGGEGSWLDLAKEALRLAGVQTDVCDVCGVSSEEYGALARRPAYSVLDLTETERALGRPMPEWRGVLANVLTQ